MSNYPKNWLMLCSEVKQKSEFFEVDIFQSLFMTVITQISASVLYAF